MSTSLAGRIIDHLMPMLALQPRKRFAMLGTARMYNVALAG